MARIAILGAAGYLGLYVVDVLRNNGHTITAVTRANGEMLLGDKNINIIHYQDVDKLNEKFDIVIDLTFPEHSLRSHIKQRNKEIIRVIQKLSHANSRIIFTSTLAVFGLGIEKPVKTQPLASRADYAYVVAKIDMENRLLKQFDKDKLSILRLGNIWGPGALVWLVKLADHLLYQKPVAAGAFGYSNITDVHNAADYIRFLVENNESEKRVFHHVAELGQNSWQKLVNPLAEALKTQPVILNQRLTYNKSIKEDIKALLRALSPTPVLYKALDKRFLAYYLRDIIASFPRKAKDAFNTMPLNDNIGKDFVFLLVMSGKNLFPNDTDTKWVPPVSEEESIKRVLSWMKGAGYLV